METIVISVGGSLLVPDAIDTNFLKDWKQFIEDQLHHTDRRIVIIAGGGQTARRYQEAVRAVGTLGSEDLDWLGVHATRLNGHLLRTIFSQYAHPTIITNPDEVLDVPQSARLIIAAGYRPGASTDLRAVEIARHTRAHKLVNLTNIDYVYTADPKQDENAEPIEVIDWSTFRTLIPAEWDPGLSSPFDPVAARLAEELELEVASIHGEHLDRLVAYLDNQEFIGTKITTA